MVTGSEAQEVEVGGPWGTGHYGQGFILAGLPWEAEVQGWQPKADGVGCPPAQPPGPFPMLLVRPQQTTGFPHPGQAQRPPPPSLLHPLCGPLSGVPLRLPGEGLLARDILSPG